MMKQEAIRELVAERLSAGEAKQVITKALGVRRNVVNRVIKMLAMRGDVKKIHRGGKQRTKRIPPTFRAVNRKIEHNPRRSIQKLAFHHDMSEKSMRRLVKNDLAMKYRAEVTKNCINSNQMSRRKERCKGILNWLKNGAKKENMLIFIEEKLFHVDPMLNI